MKFAVICVILLASTTNAFPSDESATTAQPTKAPDNGVFLGKEQSSVALKLIKIAALKSDKNQVISPLNVYAILSMLHLGAGGQTRKEISNFLNINDTDDRSVHEKIGGMLRQLRNYEGTNVSIANGIFVDKKFNVKDSFRRETEKLYDSEAKSLDLMTEGKDVVNKWGSEKTHGNIPEIVTASFTSDVTMLIASALHFEAGWFTAFDEGKTKMLPFNAGKETMQVAMMKRVSSILYSSDDALKYQSIRLPYFTTSIGFVVLLPNEGTSAKKLLESLNEESLYKALHEFQKERVNVTLPKINTKASVSLKDILVENGVSSMFDMKADLSGIGKKIQVGAAKHECAIQVNEKGTVASAISYLEVVARSFRKYKDPIIFTADRPFLFFVHDKQTDAVLFAGIVNKP